MCVLVSVGVSRSDEIVLPSERSGQVKEDYEWKVSGHSLPRPLIIVLSGDDGS